MDKTVAAALVIAENMAPETKEIVKGVGRNSTLMGMPTGASMALKCQCQEASGFSKRLKLLKTLRDAYRLLDILTVCCF